MSSSPKIKRPALRYHGGKWLLGPWIIGFFPEHRTYVEPFGGGGSVLLRKQRCYAEVYNDLDGEIVNLFRVLRDRGPELCQALMLTPFAREEFEISYLTGKSETEKYPESEHVPDVERARRVIVKSYMGIGTNAITRPNGIADDGGQLYSRPATGFRANTSRSGSIPAHDWASYPENLRAIIERLRGVVIEQRHAQLVMAAHDRPDTLHYVDPPYPHSTRNAGHDYCHEMTDEQHRELAAFLHGLKGAVVLSGYACPLYDELFAGWQRHEKQTYADGARPRVEVLWIKKAEVSA